VSEQQTTKRTRQQGSRVVKSSSRSSSS